MATCQSCGKEWSWFDTVKKLFTFRKSMRCGHCGKIQYQSKSSRNKISFIVLLPVLMIPFTVMFELSTTTVLILEVGLILAVLFIIPFFLKLSDEDEPSW